MPASMSVFLNVNDFQRSLDFYKSLGFRIDKTYNDDEGNPSWADLSFQGAELGLGRIGSNDDPEFRQWCSTPLGAGVVVYLTVTNVQRHWAKAQESGATVEQPLTERPYGTMFTVNDPDGYTLTFLQEPRKSRAADTRKSAKKTTRKSAKKGAKSASKKATTKKSGAKKASSKKTTAKKTARKSPKKAARKAAKGARKKAGARKRRA